MSLPAYLFLYDENGMLISGTNNAVGGVVSELLEDRRGGIEIMSSQHGIYQPADGATGRLSGPRQHHSYILHKQLDKDSPMLNDAVCTALLNNSESCCFTMLILTENAVILGVPFPYAA